MNKKNTKIAFFGTPEFVVPVLDDLISNDYNIVACITQSDKPQKRSRELLACATKKYAQEKNIIVFTPDKIDLAFVEIFKNLKPDLAIVAAYGLILPKEILQIPSKGFLNIHPSLLPKYRGASPLQGALLNGESKTGVTIMKMDEKMDHGPVLLQTEIEINNNDDIGTLLQKGFDVGSKLLLKILPDYLNDEIDAKEQDHDNATFTKLIKKQDGQIDWNENAEIIYNKTRAFKNWPGTYTFWNKQKLDIKKVAILPKSEDKKNVGEVYEKDGKIIINCGCGNLELIALKLAGKKEIKSKDFVHGHKKFIGSILG